MHKSGSGNKEDLLFCKEFSTLCIFVLKIELLFTVLSTFEREAPLIRITFSMGSMFDP